MTIMAKTSKNNRRYTLFLTPFLLTSSISSSVCLRERPEKKREAKLFLTIPERKRDERENEREGGTGKRDERERQGKDRERRREDTFSPSGVVVSIFEKVGKCSEGEDSNVV